MSTKPFGNESFTEEERLRLKQMLSEHLGPDELSTRKGAGAKELTYVEGFYVFQLANEIFGESGWSSQVISITDDFCTEANGTTTGFMNQLSSMTSRPLNNYLFLPITSLPLPQSSR
jgi:recombination DNA repair RAD52 pathway protein